MSKRLAPMSFEKHDSLTIVEDGIAYTIQPHQEHTRVEGNALASGDDAEDRRVERWIRSGLKRNVWAWCVVEVAAHFDGYKGVDYLGGCCYAGPKAFIRDSGYWEDMQAEARRDLENQLAGDPEVWAAYQTRNEKTPA